MEGAASKAVGNVMLTLQPQLREQQQFLFENTNVSVEKAVNNAVKKLDLRPAQSNAGVGRAGGDTD